MEHITNIIAEIGVNWDKFNKCLDMISYAKMAGADSIKLQMFSEENIKEVKDEDKRMRLHKMILTPELVKTLYNFTKQMRLNFIVTPMYIQAFDILRKTEVKLDFIKIRYADRFNSELAQAAIIYAKELSIPIIVSCDFTKAVMAAEYQAEEELDIIAMYCIPKYPAEVKDLDFSLKNLGYFGGYSNHIPNKFIPILAIARGIEIIEVHVMSDISCIDINVSLTFSELKDICKFRDEYEKVNIDNIIDNIEADIDLDDLDTEKDKKNNDIKLENPETELEGSSNE